jgi:hypothetical protein
MIIKWVYHSKKKKRQKQEGKKYLKLQWYSAWETPNNNDQMYHRRGDETDEDINKDVTDFDARIDKIVKRESDAIMTRLTPMRSTRKPLGIREKPDPSPHSTNPRAASQREEERK